MSTQLGHVDGLSLPNMGPGLRLSAYASRFYGGDANGACVQLNIGDKFAQFDRKGVVELINLLSQAYNNTEDEEKS